MCFVQESSRSEQMLYRVRKKTMRIAVLLLRYQQKAHSLFFKKKTTHPTNIESKLQIQGNKEKSSEN